jgi:hypothetical protein
MRKLQAECAANERALGGDAFVTKSRRLADKAELADAYYKRVFRLGRQRRTRVPGSSSSNNPEGTTHTSTVGR